MGLRLKYLNKLAAAEKQSVFNGNNVSDYQTQLLQFAAPDIYVTVEYQVSEVGGLFRAVVLLKGFDTSTGNNLGAKDGNRSNANNDPALLVSWILANGMAEEFLNSMQTKFTEMLEDGRQVSVSLAKKSTVVKPRVLNASCTLIRAVRKLKSFSRIVRMSSSCFT